MNSDPEVMRYFPAPLSREESDAMADRISGLIAERGWGFFALELKTEKRFIGFTGLHTPFAKLPFGPCVEIGWRLARDQWGRGLATEAAREALRFGFGDLKVPEIVSFTAVGNARSRAVMERLGMRRDGDFDHPDLPEGNPLRRHALYRLAAP